MASLFNPLDHQACLTFPGRLTPYSAWHEHIPFAMFLVDILRPKLIVELGTQYGDSYCAFCQAVKDLHLDTRCHAIDTWVGDSHTGQYGPEVLADLREHHDPLYGRFSTLIQSTFDGALTQFPDGSVDILHIDGAHTYEEVKHDFDSWLPKVSSGGVVLFHDTNVREQGFGVPRFWNEVKAFHPQFEFVHGHGLGLMAKEKVSSPVLQELFSLRGKDVETVQNLFFQLGYRLTLQSNSETKDALIEGKTNRVAELEKGAAALEQQLSQLRHREQTLVEQVEQQEDKNKQNFLQVFWCGKEGYSEDHSVKAVLLEGSVNEYYLELPVGSRGPLRIDLGNRPSFVEIDCIEIFVGKSHVGEEEPLTRWSEANNYSGLVLRSGVVRLTGQKSLRLICLDDDPQLLLDGIPESCAGPYLLRMSVRASNDLQDTIATEINKLQNELQTKEKYLSQHLDELSAVQTEFLNKTKTFSLELAEKEKERQRLQVDLEQQEQLLHNLRLQLKVEQDALVSQVTSNSESLRSISKDLLRMEGQLVITTRSLSAQLSKKERLIHKLQTRAAEQERALSTLQANSKVQYKNLIRQVELSSRSLQFASNVFSNKEKSLVAQSADKETEARRVQDEMEHEMHTLRDEFQTEQRRLTELAAEKEVQLRRVTRSFVWRLLSQNGQLRFRHAFGGVIKLANQRVRDWLELILRRECCLSVMPINQLHLLDDGQTWESTGRDPQFYLPGPWPTGWTKVLVEIETYGGGLGDTRLYVDRGDGYSEADSYDLGTADGRQEAFVKLGSDVVSVRLDPFEAPGKFKLARLTLKRVSSLEVKAKGTNGQDFATYSRLKEFAEFSLRRLRNYRKREGHLPPFDELSFRIRLTWRAWRIHQLQNGILPKRALSFDIREPIANYDAWLEANEWNQRRSDMLGERLSDLKEQPLLSVVMPVYNPPLEFLDKAIQSVVDQVYGNWELCIADDASTDPAVKPIIEEWSNREPRIRLAFSEENQNISCATNAAAGLALGEYVVLMDQDDELTPDALGEVASYLAANPETEMLYSDDDKINSEGGRFAPQFKPDWSPELLLSYMYMSHLLVLRRDLFWRVGGLRVGFEGSQDYDLALRATEIATHIGHLPRILYHWRIHPGSTAASGSAKPNSFSAGLRAVQEALDRRGIHAEAFQPESAIQSNCGVYSHRFSDEGPRVAIIIPTRNAVEVLSSCIESLSKTTYTNYEVVIIDNESDDLRTLRYLQTILHTVLRIPNAGSSFNYAAVNNAAVNQITADYVLFLNNDTEVISPNWLSQMMGYMSISGVGAVGARLLFPNGLIQHAGVVHGYHNGLPGPAFKLLPSHDSGYLGYAGVVRNYSAVTAACLLTPRDLFLQLGGFDEDNFAVAYNDVDYCYRLHNAGYRIVYCPTAELIHHEGYSRAPVDKPSEPAAFLKRYRDRKDPFYNPNLSLDHGGFSVGSSTIAPEVCKPIRTLLCAFSLKWEGSSQSQYELAVQLKEQNVIDPVVYCPEDGPLRRAYEEKGIEVKVFEHPLTGVFSLREYERATERFAKWTGDQKVEVVFANTLETFYAIEAAKRLDVPSIWNPRESESWQTYFSHYVPDIAKRALQCFAYPYKVVFVADATRDVYLSLNSHHNFVTIHNGLDRERFNDALHKWPRDIARNNLSLSDDQIMVLSLGTICKRKGQLDLLDAIEGLDEQQAARLRCFIVGDRTGDYSEAVKKAHERLPTSRRLAVQILPESPDPALYYSAADVFVCTSLVESFPRVILEAMATGLPIITTPVYGIVEQVQKNFNALFYPPGKTGSLTKALSRLIEEPDLRRKLGDNSRARLDSLIDFESMVSAYDKLIREAWLSGRARTCAAS